MMTVSLITILLFAAATLSRPAASPARASGVCPGVRAGFLYCRSSVEARRFRFPAGWLKQAFCIHRHESVDWRRRWVDWRGLPSPYAGGMQFLQSTWERAGGRGEPWMWPIREQVYRAFVIWDMQNSVRGDRLGDWSEWGTAGKCGLS